MPHWGKTIGEQEVVGGFSCASLIAGGLVIWAAPGWAVSAPILIVFGLLAFIDDIVPYGRQPHLASESGGFMVGILAVAVSFFSGFLVWLLAVAALLTAIKFAPRVLRQLKTFKT